MVPDFVTHVLSMLMNNMSCQSVSHSKFYPGLVYRLQGELISNVCACVPAACMLFGQVGPMPMYIHLGVSAAPRSSLQQRPSESEPLAPVSSSVLASGLDSFCSIGGAWPLHSRFSVGLVRYEPISDATTPDSASRARSSGRALRVAYEAERRVLWCPLWAVEVCVWILLLLVLRAPPSLWELVSR